MAKFSRYEMFYLWEVEHDDYDFVVANKFCGKDDYAFDILTDFYSRYGSFSFKELMNWIYKMGEFGTYTLVSVYEIAGRDIETFALYMEDMFNTYSVVIKNFGF